MLSDIEIAKGVKLDKITDVAAKLNIDDDNLTIFGKYMAKVEPKNNGVDKSKLILVTAINPTPAGEGKTTISIGLADAMSKCGVKVALALREPSLGPVFGIKGGATGGGYAQVGPMEDINLNFTGDIHAITSANNLLSAMIDNHIYWGNELNIKNVTWRRCMDMNDRSLRNFDIEIKEGMTFSTGFDITAASEIMAILCLASDIDDLKLRLGNIIIGQDTDGKDITAKDIKAHTSMAVILKDAIKPNLVQTLAHIPAFIHGGPFANIAHGCNSIISTKTAMSYADYVVTEAGFGADLGAEKFFDIKCRLAKLNPTCVILVATVRALKYAGGNITNYKEKDIDSLKKGLPNLTKHIENITNIYNQNLVVAINRFEEDDEEEINLIKQECDKLQIPIEICESHSLGCVGGVALAKTVIDICKKDNRLQFAYELNDSIKEKIKKVATKIYGATNVEYSKHADEVIHRLKATNVSNLPICIAKTQYSLSDNPKLIGRPTNFNITVNDVILKQGAGFITVICGNIMLMPGLSKCPNAENITITNGEIKGLF